MMCLLGQRSFYQRRITDHCCYNGREYIRPEKQLYSNCTREDYEWCGIASMRFRRDCGLRTCYISLA